MWHPRWLSGMRRTDDGCVRRGVPALEPGRDRLAWLLFGQRSLRVHTRRGPVRGSPRRHARAVRTVAKPEALALVVAGGCRGLGAGLYHQLCADADRALHIAGRWRGVRTWATRWGGRRHEIIPVEVQRFFHGSRVRRTFAARRFASQR